MFRLENRDIPPEGLDLEGEITEDIFQLPDGDNATPVGPVRYKAKIYNIDDELTVEGDFEADFEVECSRCLEKFRFPVKLQAHSLSENLENPTEADLTQALREDILLALPVYPDCEEGKTPRNCPAKGKFETANRAPAVEESSEESTNQWAELDNLDGLEKESSD